MYDLKFLLYRIYGLIVVKYVIFLCLNNTSKLAFNTKFPIEKLKSYVKFFRNKFSDKLRNIAVDKYRIIY